jgi:hypothetical protein
MVQSSATQNNLSLAAYEQNTMIKMLVLHLNIKRQLVLYSGVDNL